ncbi:ankyrin repeat domain-containing protein [Nannocystis punicea]|uniref:Ankyrin repeat domain-containing protein n=1 Tax=Nannocystis punicea TaxID=2995304 RepID=A0ABY7GX43_9BACT|nr:ankyrin repeat domain-containing protein [Nannocystis poenicansa]WAS91559.1 ankyrin repeat domain-containing protein [Nannocystis poenicansa]
MWRRRKTDPLLLAIRAGDLGEVERLAAAGLDLNQEYDKSAGHKVAPVEQAAISDRAHVLEWLLARGARLEGFAGLDNMLLASAVRVRRPALVRTLLERGVRPEPGPFSPLYEAAFSRSLEIFELLLDHGADVRELEAVDAGMLARVSGDILRRAIAAGARLPPSTVELALSHTALGDDGRVPAGYRR